MRVTSGEVRFFYYKYGRGNPIKYNDPSGHCIWDACIVESIALYAAAAAVATAYVAVSYTYFYSPDAAQNRADLGEGIENAVDGIGLWHVPPPRLDFNLKGSPIAQPTAEAPEGFEIGEEEAAGIPGVRPETPPLLVSTWVGNNPSGIHFKNGFLRGTTDMPGGIDAASDLFAKYAGRLPNLWADPNNTKPSDTFITPDGTVISIRPNSGSGTPAIDIKDTKAGLMKKFTSIHDVSIEDVLDVLKAWEDDLLPYDKVQLWAEIVLLSGWQEYAKDDPISILAWVVETLEDMYMEPILKKDIPILRMILQESKSTLSGAWLQIEAFMASTNWAYRRQQAYHNMQTYHDQRLDTISDPE